MPTRLKLQPYQQQPQQDQEHRESAIYQPSIFRYKCRGGFFASSEEVGSHGLCRGIQSQLQHVRDLPPAISKEESLQTFLQSYYSMSSQSSTDFVSMIESTGNNNKNKDKQKRNGPTNSIDDILQVPVIVYPTVTVTETATETANNNSSTQVPTLKETLTDNNPSHHDDHDDDTVWHDWACYGSTSVNLLVLRNTVDGTEETLAVAPINDFGFEIRDVGSPEQQVGEMVCTAHVGPIQILMENRYELEELPESKQTPTSTQQANQDGKARPKHSHQEQRIKHTTTPNVNEINSQGAQGDNHPTRNTSISAMTFIRFGHSAFAYSEKIVTAMKHNAVLLKDAVRDDFPNRCLQSSGRIIGQFGKTIETTTAFVQKIYRFWNDDDDDHGND